MAALFTARVEHDEHAGIVVTLTMPLPPASLGKNGRPGHWSERARDYRAHRGWVHLALTSALVAETAARTVMLPLWDSPVQLTATWYADSRGHLPDTDGVTQRIACYIDGGQDAELYRDDSLIERIDVVRRVDAANPRVVLEWRGMERET